MTRLTILCPDDIQLSDWWEFLHARLRHMAVNEYAQCIYSSHTDVMLHIKRTKTGWTAKFYKDAGND